MINTQERSAFLIILPYPVIRTGHHGGHILPALCEGHTYTTEIGRGYKPGLLFPEG